MKGRPFGGGDWPAEHVPFAVVEASMKGRPLRGGDALATLVHVCGS